MDILTENLFELTINESYTSICDALCLEPVGIHDDYKGDRTIKGLFKSSTGHCINADVNGTINIMRKYANRYRPNLTPKIERSIKSNRSITYMKKPKKCISIRRMLKELMKNR